MKSERLKFIPSEEGNVLEIYPYIDENKQKFLLLWLVAFSIGGLAVISQLFTAVSSELKIMIMIFAFFWAYYEYKVLKAYLWRRKGKEKLVFTDDKLYYGRLFGDRGILYPYNKDLLGGLKKVDVSEKNFFTAMSDSYWIISGEKLAFTYAGKQVPFGLRLNTAEVNLIIKRTQAYFKED